MKQISFVPQRLSPEEKDLHQRALQAAGRFRTAQADLLELILEVDCKRLFEKFARRSTFAYCIDLLGLSEDMACTFIRVARKCQEIPELKAAVKDGPLTLSKARKIATILTRDNQAHWISRAILLPHAELEKELAAEHPQSVHERVKPMSSTRYKIEFGLEQEALVQLKRAQDILSTKRGRSVTFEETICTVIDEFLEAEDPVRKAERARPVKSAPGASKRTGAIPKSVIHAVNKRDGQKCQARDVNGKVCHGTRWLHFHHCVPRADGGENTAENITTLCGFHHRLLHRMDSA